MTNFGEQLKRRGKAKARQKIDVEDMLRASAAAAAEMGIDVPPVDQPLARPAQPDGAGGAGIGVPEIIRAQAPPGLSGSRDQSPNVVEPAEAHQARKTRSAEFARVYLSRECWKQLRVAAILRDTQPSKLAEIAIQDFLARSAPKG